MEKQEIIRLAEDIFASLKNNLVHLPKEDAFVKVLESPVIGFAPAEDPLYDEFLKPEVIGPEFRKPSLWMENAKAVMAFFFPFTEDIKKRRRASEDPTDEAWAMGYGSRNDIVDTFLKELIECLNKQGIDACDPLKDPRMEMRAESVNVNGVEDIHFSVAWSTRHICFVAGMGTFGIHRHIITEKGCMGTLATLIISEYIEADERKYSGVYEYCIGCNACIKACPAGAITHENLRNLIQCRNFASSLKETYNSGFCGRCMVGVPCESQRPAAYRVKV